ncbi:MAG: hypothetical protein EA396_12860 [Anaerolineaceae bacterium]|nr:MAG: hypothetical protein EA396_12860 [Anaerolineaceae bacterium]
MSQKLTWTLTLICLTLLLIVSGCSSGENDEVSPQAELSVEDAVAALFTATAVASSQQDYSPTIEPTIATAITAMPTQRPVDQDPTQVAEIWYAATMAADGVTLARYTCRASSSQASDAMFLFGALTGGLSELSGGMLDGLMPQIDTSQIRASLLNEQSGRASVRLLGETYMSFLGAFETVQVDTVLNLVYEDNRWKVCDI